MGNIEKVAAINNPAYKTGMGKNGKEWTLAQVTTDKNNVTTVFMPIGIGDSVELTWNDQYGNYSATKVNKQDQATIEGIKELYKLGLAIYKAVTGEEYGKEAPVKGPDVIVEPTPEQESSGLSDADIPDFLR